MKEQREIKRGDVFYIFANSGTVGNEQRQGRPGLVVSNNQNNKYSSVIEVVYVTSQKKKPLPTHVTVRLSGQDATVLCEQIDSVSVHRFGNFMGHIHFEDMALVNQALKTSLAL